MQLFSRTMLAVNYDEIYSYEKKMNGHQARTIKETKSHICFYSYEKSSSDFTTLRFAKLFS